MNEEDLMTLIIEGIMSKDNGHSKVIMERVEGETTTNFSRYLAKFIQTAEEYKPGIFSGVILRCHDHLSEENVRKEIYKMKENPEEELYRAELMCLFGHIVSHGNARGIKISSEKARKNLLNLVNEYLKSEGYSALSYKIYEREPEYIWRKIRGG